MEMAVPQLTPSAWTLLQRDDCHLCDLALIEMARARFPEFDSVFVDDDPALEMRWGDQVPVLLAPQGAAFIAWPFAAEDLRRLLEVYAGADGHVVRDDA